MKSNFVNLREGNSTLSCPFGIDALKCTNISHVKLTTPHDETKRIDCLDSERKFGCSCVTHNELEKNNKFFFRYSLNCSFLCDKYKIEYQVIRKFYMMQEKQFAW